MRRRLLLLAAIVAVPTSAYAQADNPRLSGVVGPAYNISLLDANGQSVARLDPGAFDIAVRDLSDEHNFHLSGPGVDETTSVTGTGNASWTVTFREGRYTFVCDPHSTDMRGTIVVGNPPTPPPPTPRPPVVGTVTRLTAAVGPANTISLKNAAGANVRALKAGRYRITVRDRTKLHSFHLVGVQLNRKTTLAGMGTFTWTVTLRKGKLSFYSDHKTMKLRKSVTVT
jgi:Copper binding proteins, plastocyanin/azurin family